MWLLITLALVGVFVAQFRPAKRQVWAQRWQRIWGPMFLAIGAMLKMAWQGFVRDPALRLWRRQSATREARASMEQTIDRLLGRNPES